MIVGAGLFTVNPFCNTPGADEGLVTVTFHLPAVTPSRSNLQIIMVGLITTTSYASTSGPAVLFTSFTVAPDSKLVPARFVIVTGQPRAPLLGVMEVTVGVGPGVIVGVGVTVPVPDGEGPKEADDNTDAPLPPV